MATPEVMAHLLHVGVNLNQLAEAISIEESNANDLKQGPNGELGRYQIQQQLWQQISFLPFQSATDPLISKKVAIRHLEWLQKKLQDHASLDHSRVYLLALGWHAGPQAVLHLFSTGKQREYAERVESLYLQKSPTPPP